MEIIFVAARESITHETNPSVVLGMNYLKPCVSLIANKPEGVRQGSTD